MANNIWVVEVNLSSDDLFDYRITTSDQMLLLNAARAFSKANGLSTRWKGSNWVVIGMARSEEEAHQKAARFKPMMVSEKEHALATGESLYLRL